MKLNPKLFIDVIFPVGTSYITNNPSFNPNTAWGGTWVKDCEGQTIVGQKANDSDFGTLDDVVGEKTHTLTINEMPSHTHDEITASFGQSLYTGESIDNVSNQMGVRNNSGSNSSSFKEKLKTSAKGGNQPHNNIQPSKIKIIWTRTA